MLDKPHSAKKRKLSILIKSRTKALEKQLSSSHLYCLGQDEVAHQAQRFRDRVVVLDEDHDVILAQLHEGGLACSTASEPPHSVLLGAIARA